MERTRPQYVFEAEPYGGAVTRGLERDDYGVLPSLTSDAGAYRLLVTNEVNETQMTNLFELWAVDHPAGLRVVPDEWGRLHTLSQPPPPRSAIDLTGPRGFWALGHFAMDYSADQPVSVDTIVPRRAAGNTPGDILAAVTSADTLYHAMPNTGDRAILEFTAPAARAGMERTMVLHSRGWYRLHLTPSGPPDTAMVRRVLEVPGAAVQYSARKYRQWPMATRAAR